MRPYATLYDIYMTGKPRYTIIRVDLYTVTTRYMTSRICDLMRHVVVYRTETAVLQDSTKSRNGPDF